MAIPLSQNAFLLVCDALFSAHTSPTGHPESSARLQALSHAFSQDPLLRDAVRISPREATLEELTCVHDENYATDTLQRLRNGRSGYLEGDTFYSPGTRHAALCAAGASIDLALAVHQRGQATGFAALRPPGHHATQNRAMGFCIFNNVAIAAAQLLQRGQAKRVAILDWDVHHGNGTQDIFYGHPNVFFMSIHQSPLYPGSGGIDEIGRGDAQGRTLNVPFPPHTKGADYLAVLRALFVPLCQQFRPDHILVSAGFDAHHSDPLSAMGLVADDFGAMAQMLRTLADALCQGRLTFLLEGGYQLDALGSSAVATLKAALSPSTPVVSSLLASPQASEIIRDLQRRIAPFWAPLSPVDNGDRTPRPS
ncbi:MAG: histone deacetylase [Proteobacteria bacterium]|nr:histone deacetylase [Pseudomonadota bacterium]